jgi:hypothetical protein
VPIDPVAAKAELQKRGRWTPQHEARFKEMVDTNATISKAKAGDPSKTTGRNMLDDVGNVGAGMEPTSVGSRFVNRHPGAFGGQDPNDSMFASRAGLTRSMIDNLPNIATTLGSSMVGAAMTPLGGPAAGMGAGAGVAPFLGAASKAVQTGLFEGRAPTGGEMAQEATIQGVSEIAGAGMSLAAPFQRVIRKGGGKIIAEAAEVSATMKSVARDYEEALVRRGTHTRAQAKQAAQIALTPAQLHEGRVLDYIDNFVAGSGLFGGAHAKIAQSQHQALNMSVDALVEVLGPTMDPDDIAETVGHIFKTNMSRDQDSFGAMHEAVKRRLRTRHVGTKEVGLSGPGAEDGLLTPKGSELIVEDTGSKAGLVDMRGIRRESLEEYRQYLAGIGSKAPDPERLKTLVGGLDDLPDFASFDDVMKYRSDLGEALALAKGPNKNEKFSRAAGELYHDLTRASDNALKAYDRAMRAKVGPSYIGAHDMQKDADAGYKAVKRHWDKRFVNKFLSFAADDPRAMETGRAILNQFTGPGNAGKIQEFKRMIGGESEEGWRAMRKFVVADIQEKSALPNGGTDARKMIDHLTSPRKLGEDASDLILGKEKGEMVRLLNALQATQKKNAAPGKSAASLTEPGMIMLAASAAMAGSGSVGAGLAVPATYALAMTGLQKALLSPTLRDLLGKATRAKQGTRLATSLTAKILGNMVAGQDYIEIPRTASADEYRAAKKALRDAR